MALIEAGPMHRLALAVEDSAAARDWFATAFGSAPIGETVIPFTDDVAAVTEGIRRSEGSDSQMMWQGGFPLLFLAPLGEDGYVRRHLTRWGAGVHSVAWEIADMWTADARLRDRRFAITGVNIAGRHFFVHPRDTHGVLVEFTDSTFERDPRRGAGTPDANPGVVPGAEVAWVTAVVSDAGAAAALFEELVDARRVEGNAARPPAVEDTRDLRIGDLTLRLVSPRSAESPYAEVLRRGPRFYSYTMRLPDLDAGLDALGSLGVRTLGRDGDLARVDPRQTFGVPLELTA